MNTISTIPTPTHKLGIVMFSMVEQGINPCFRIGDIRITVAGPTSVNLGSLYIRDSTWAYIGKITLKGFMKITHPSLITCEQKEAVLAAIVDPENAAISQGKTTGICSCCGRKLTNKDSIKLGIGPICKDRWFSAPIEIATVDDNIVTELAHTYLSLSSKEKDKFLGLIEGL